jgi:predicted transcriptional regulator
MGKPVASLKIRDIMTHAPIAVIYSDKIRAIMTLFIDKQISGAPVIEPATGKVLSVVSEADLMKFAALTHNLDEPLLTFKAKLPATEDLITVESEDPFSEVYKRFITKPVRRVIVIDKSKHLIGIVARRDILKAFLQSQT